MERCGDNRQASLPDRAAGHRANVPAGDVISVSIGARERSDRDGTRLQAGRQRSAALARALAQRISQPVVLQDERLSSVEAESRLAVRDKDWRSRKKKLDAAAAAVILQDYLDARQDSGVGFQDPGVPEP